jgi:hypothetical protein
MAKGYPLLALDPLWRDRILELVREEGSTGHSPQLDETEDKLLPKIGWLYGTPIHYPITPGTHCPQAFFDGLACQMNEPSNVFKPISDLIWKRCLNGYGSFGMSVKQFIYPIARFICTAVKRLAGTMVGPLYAGFLNSKPPLFRHP